MTRVLVTRPMPEALVLAQALEEKGLEPIISPLLEIRPIRIIAPKPEEVAGVIITSANGARFAPVEYKKASIPAFCVGQHTAHIAESEGFKVVAVAKGNARDLIDVVSKDPPNETDGRILYLRGVDVTTRLAPLLGARGYQVEELIVYEAKKMPEFSAAADAFFKEPRDCWVVLFSARTAEHFLSLIKASGVGSALPQLNIVTVSETVAEKLGKTRVKSLFIAEKADNSAIIDIILAHLT